MPQVVEVVVAPNVPSWIASALCGKKAWRWPFCTLAVKLILTLTAGHRRATGYIDIVIVRRVNVSGLKLATKMDMLSLHIYVDVSRALVDTEEW